MKSNEFSIKVLVIVLAIITPLIFVGLGGEQKTISAYWNSDYRPLYIMTNAATSYFMFTVPKWKLSAFALLGLTAFSVDQYLGVHNVFAGIFFVSSFFAIVLTKRFLGFAYLYLIFAIVCLVNVLVGEVMLVEIICVYHLHMLIYFNKLLKRNC
jgi:hypothetical protein